MERVLKSISVLSLLAIVSVALANPAEARPRGINRRECRQQNRIGQGAQTGSLTNRETARLEHQQANLRKREAYMRQSGNGLSLQERRKLEQQENRLSHNVYQQKHDGQHY